MNYHNYPKMGIDDYKQGQLHHGNYIINKRPWRAA